MLIRLDTARTMDSSRRVSDEARKVRCSSMSLISFSFIARYFSSFPNFNLLDPKVPLKYCVYLFGNTPIMPATPRSNYPYPVPNSELIATHSLQKHFEGGFFVQSVAVESAVPKLPAPQNAHLPQSDALRGRVQHALGPGTELLCGPSGNEPVGEDKRLDATLIYYLLTPESYRGKMHMNLHSVRRSALLVDLHESIILTSRDFRLSISITLGGHFTLSYDLLRKMVMNRQFAA